MRLIITFAIITLFSLASNADWSSQVAKACFHDKSNLQVCKETKELSKKMEKVSKDFLKKQGMEEGVAVFVFTADTLSKGYVEIPQVLPWYDNSLHLAPNSVELKFNIPFNL